jgi:hypothetical protein
MRIEQLDLSEWRDALPDSGIEVFHRPEALATLDDHAAGDLELYGGFKGQEPIGLLPVFTSSRFVGTTVTSPPPSMNVPRLGPVVMPTSPKQRKIERVNRDFTEEVLDAIDVAGSLSLFRTICHSDYADPRPYLWEDYDLSTQFTYVVDLQDREPDDVLSSFSSGLRRDIRDAQDLAVTVSIEGIDGARDVYEQTKARYEEQGRGFPLSWEYVRDLVENLGEHARVYVVRGPDGEFLSGITALYSTDHAYFWQGGTRADYDGTSVNSLLHWRIITDILEDPNLDHVTGYDLMGANTERLCKYKSKFAADLVPYYVVESDSVGMDVAKATYQTLKR